MNDATNITAGNDRQDDRPLARGIKVLKSQLRTMPSSPGVYRMLNEAGTVLYVGKARNLKARVSSYTNPGNLSHRIMRMVALTRSLIVVTTHTEVEALLLEANLIKRYRPHYNILLKDDKAFPYVRITGGHNFPQIMKHRGARTDKAEYFGPFASAGAVNKTLNVLQRAFLLRTCTDSIFASRSRPCLLHQIKRCSAPCVDRISRADYAALVGQARDFLRGRSQNVKSALSARMLEASEALDFESAAIYRNRLQALSQVQSAQEINNSRLGDMDAIAAYQAAGQTCVMVFFFRNGQNWGDRAFFPRHDKSEDLPQILSAFISQFYDDKPPPPELLVNGDVAEQDLLQEALTVKAGRRIRIIRPKRSDRRRLLDTAERNARVALERRLAESSSQQALLEAVADLFALDGPPKRIEVYDNSHISGTNAIGAMIVAGPEGFEKGQYRKFNIRSEDLSPGDDYGMMREVMTRRFGRLLKEDPTRERGNWPDLVLIDGGIGQLNAVRGVLDDLGVGDVPLVGVAKGPDRNAGREDFHLPDRPPFKLPPGNAVLYYIQRLRDEAHRFAIAGHRARRGKESRKSILDEVAGIGPRRKRALLLHFGSAQAVARAAIADLEAVDGINRTTAEVIYNHFHDKG